MKAAGRSEARPVQFGRVPYKMVDSGGVGKMLGSEAKTYLVLAAHANSQLRATPTVERIARLSGQGRRTVQKAVKGLRDKGLLCILPGGGRSKTNVYCLRENSAQADAVSEREKAHAEGVNGAGPREERASGGARNGAPADARTDLNRVEQTSTGTVDGVLPAGDTRNSFAGQNAKVLRRIGLAGNCVDELAAAPGLKPLEIAVLALQAPRDVGNLAGWVRSRLEAGRPDDNPRPSPKLVYHAVKKGYIVRVGDYAFDVPGRSPGFNDLGFCVKEGNSVIARIPARDLANVDVE